MLSNDIVESSFVVIVQDKVNLLETLLENSVSGPGILLDYSTPGILYVQTSTNPVANMINSHKL